MSLLLREKRAWLLHLVGGNDPLNALKVLMKLHVYEVGVVVLTAKTAVSYSVQAVNHPIHQTVITLGFLIALQSSFSDHYFFLAPNLC